MTTVTVTAAHAGTSPAAALTTIFTPSYSFCSTTSSRFLTSSCMPTNWALYYYGTQPYYSPAICPTGYTIAGDPKSGFGPPIDATETAKICCPSSFSYGYWTSFCISPTSYWTTTTSTSTIASGTYSTYYSSFTTTTSADAYALQIRWASSDLPNLETDPLTRTLSRSSTSTTITKTTTSASASASASESASASTSTSATPSPIPASDLSTEAKIAIGVVVPVVVLGLLIAGAVLFYNRRQHRQSGRGPGNVSAQPDISASQSEKIPSTTMAPSYPNYPGFTPQPMPQPMQQPMPQPMPQPGLNYQVPPQQPTYIIPAQYEQSTPPQQYMPLDPPTPVVPSALQELEEERQRVQERRSRLLQLQQLDDEEERLKMQMTVLQGTRLELGDTK